MKNFGLKRAMGAIASAFMFFVMSSCSFVGSGDISGGDVRYSDNDLKAKDFKKIEVSVVADVFYTQNDSDLCKVKLDFSDIDNPKVAESLKDKVKVLYRNEGVEVVMDGRITGVGNMESGHRLKVYVTSPDIVKVTMVGVGSFHLGSVNSDELSINNEGVGSIYAKNLLVNKCNVDNEGVGSVKVDSIKADILKIDNEGVGGVKIGKFDGGKVFIDNEGVGKVAMDVNCDYIKAVLEGVGGIHLSGVTRQLDEKRDGVGSVKKKDLKILQ